MEVQHYMMINQPKFVPHLNDQPTQVCTTNQIWQSIFLPIFTHVKATEEWYNRRKKKSQLINFQHNNWEQDLRFYEQINHTQVKFSKIKNKKIIPKYERKHQPL